VVLLHHSVIPYTYFGTPIRSRGSASHDRARHRQFFMRCSFPVGLFVWPGIARKGPLNYLSDRLLRLGLPFVICALTIIPIAYYAISLRIIRGRFSEFWWTTVTKAVRVDRSGSFGSCSASTWLLASCIAVSNFSIRSIASRCTVTIAGRVLRVMFAVTAALYIPGEFTSSRQLVRVRPFSSSTAACALRYLFFFGAGIGLQYLNRGLLAADGG